jgi:hypothetical protein
VLCCGGHLGRPGDGVDRIALGLSPQSQEDRKIKQCPYHVLRMPPLALIELVPVV